MEIPQTFKDEIWDYCRVNSITNVDDFMLKLLKQGFTIEKYGATPEPRVIEKIVEKVVSDNEETKKIHAQLQEEIQKNNELTKKLEKLNTKDIYGEG